MSGNPDRLSKEEHLRIFREQVLPESGLDRISPQDHPRAIILAGQPGAGKGSLKNAAIAEFNYEIFPVDPDDKREYHTAAKRWQEESPYGWSQKTNSDAGNWASELRDAGIERRVNLLIDTTLSDSNAANRLIEGLKNAGYEVEVRAIAAHELESRVGIDRRFTKDIDRSGVGRDVPLDFHDRAYANLPDNLDAVAAKTGVRVRIYDRDDANTAVFDSQRDPGPPSAALRETRDARIQSPTTTQRMRIEAQEQADWHRDPQDRLVESGKMSPQTLEALRQERLEADKPTISARDSEAWKTLDEHVRPGTPQLRTTPLEPDLPIGLRRSIGGGVALIPGAALAVYQFEKTLDYARTQQDVLSNPRAAEDALRREGAQVAAGVAGSAAAYGAALALSTGTGGTFLLMAGGAYAASELADKAMDWWEHREVVVQKDKDGVVWEYKGIYWESQNVRGDLTDDDINNPEKRKFIALPEKARELNYMASTVRVEQELGKVPQPRNPFVQPSGDGDTYSLRDRPWIYQADSGQWQREIVTGFDDNDIPNQWKYEQASPERAAQLSAQAVQAIEDNLKQGPAVLAAEYQIAYKRYGWSNDGPESKAVEAALDPNMLQASDGNYYRRDAQGQWAHEGEAALANRALELELTRDRLLPALQQHAQMLSKMHEWQPPTPEQYDRDLLKAEYARHGVAPTPEQFEAAYTAVQRTRADHGLSMANTSLDLLPDEKGKFSVESPIQHLRMQQKDVVELAAVTSAAEISAALEPQPIRGPGVGSGLDRDAADEAQTAQPPKSAALISDPGFDALAHQTWLQTRSTLGRASIDGLDNLTAEQRERLTANVAARVLGDVQTGMTDVTRIDASTLINPQTGMPQYLIPGQGDPTTAHYKRVAVDVGQAIEMPVERASEIAKAGVEAREQTQAQALAQAHTLNQDGPGGPTMRIGGRTLGAGDGSA